MRLARMFKHDACVPRVLAQTRADRAGLQTLNARALAAPTATLNPRTPLCTARAGLRRTNLQLSSWRDKCVIGHIHSHHLDLL